MILIVDMNFKGSLGYHEFVTPLCDIASSFGEYEVKHYSDISEVNVYDAIILSGTPLKDSGYMDNLSAFERLKTSTAPVFGICAGMQTIGLIFDSCVKKNQEIGMTEINTVKENFLFSSQFHAYELHTYEIEPSGEFEILAESKKCIQAIKHKRNNMYGVLFHPEVRNKWVIERFLCQFGIGSI